MALCTSSRLDRCSLRHVVAAVIISRDTKLPHERDVEGNWLAATDIEKGHAPYAVEVASIIVKISAYGTQDWIAMFALAQQRGDFVNLRR
ncbi:hypothetical protein ASF22_21620 [Methylobacterium sp. Leaf87]|nr:hypothetical protein ASF22_21620 [Methylobacterium sp. Leaf87]